MYVEKLYSGERFQKVAFSVTVSSDACGRKAFPQRKSCVFSKTDMRGRWSTDFATYSYISPNGENKNVPRFNLNNYQPATDKVTGSNLSNRQHFSSYYNFIKIDAEVVRKKYISIKEWYLVIVTTF